MFYDGLKEGNKMVSVWNIIFVGYVLVEKLEIVIFVVVFWIYCLYGMD